MIKIALQHNGKLSAGSVLPGAGNKAVQNLSSGSEEGSLGGDTQPFSMLLTKLVNKASQLKTGASSPARQEATRTGNAASGADMDGEQETPLFMLKISGILPGEEQEAKLSAAIGKKLISLEPLSEDGTVKPGDEVFSLVDLQALIQALQDAKTAGENSTEPFVSSEEAAALSSYLAAMISALQGQGDTVKTEESIGNALTAKENLIPAMPGVAGGATETISINSLLALGENILADGADKGNKILLTLPQELVKDFVVNKNGQPHFAPNGFVDEDASAAVLATGDDAVPAGQSLSPEGIRLAQSNTASLSIPVLSNKGEASVFMMAQAMGENDPAKGSETVKSSLALPTEGPAPTVQLVRLNSLASSSSPQGALLAAAGGLQKTNQTSPAAPVVDSGDATADGSVAVDPLQNETLVKNTGERQVREMLLNPDSESTGNKVTMQAGMNPQPGVFSQSQESDGQDPVNAGKGVDAGEEALLGHKDPAKGILLTSGKESAQWVPYAGATSPQVPLGAEAPLKGVFIPMDRLVSAAGAALEKGAGKVQMTLQPPSLGTINMEVVVQNNRVELVLTANHADVQQILQGSSDQLKNALNNQGFQVDQMSVLLRRENFGFNLGGNSLWQDGSGRQQSNGNGSSASPSAPDVENVIPRRDYGTGTISIFA